MCADRGIYLTPRVSTEADTDIFVRCLVRILTGTLIIIIIIIIIIIVTCFRGFSQFVRANAEIIPLTRP